MTATTWKFQHMCCISGVNHIGDCGCFVVATGYEQSLQFGVVSHRWHGKNHTPLKRSGRITFAIVKLDMHNAFNLVSHQVVVDLCAVIFQNFNSSLCIMVLFQPSAPLAQHGTTCLLASGVQQGDPLGSLLSPLSFMQHSKLLWLILSALI